VDKLEDNFTVDINYLVFRKCTASWVLYEHELDSCDITYVVSGSAQYTIDGKTYDVSEGDLLCVPEGSLRAGITYTKNLMQCFSADFLLKDTKGKSMALPFPLISHIGHKQDIIRLFLELMYTWQDKQPGYMIKSRGLLLLILQRLLEIIVYNTDSEAGDFRIKRVIRYIQANYSKKITVKKMAEMIGLNATYFGARFKRDTGLSLNHFLMRTRVRNAENMLMSGEYSVEATAEVCGFSDEVHFYKCFKKLLGFAPSQCIPKRHK
jgi:AraC-like DNA-binding protein